MQSVTVSISIALILYVRALPILISNTVEGAAAKAVSAFSFNNSGTLTCPDGITTFIADDESSDEGIEFSGRTDSLNQGQWTIYELRDGYPPDASSSYDTRSGTVTSVTVQGKNFVIEGTETNDGICRASTEGTTIRITGTRGKERTIIFTASNGERGEYQGLLDCITIKGSVR